MTLGELIEVLKSADPDHVVRIGFGRPTSYRGYYAELAFVPEQNVTVRSMLAHAQCALGHTFTGYKGGEYRMDEYTPVWIAEWGCCGEAIGPILLEYMLGEATCEE
jgi:hypothetical protein